jgi:hypothetical protein
MDDPRERRMNRLPRISAAIAYETRLHIDTERDRSQPKVRNNAADQATIRGVRAAPLGAVQQ